MFHIIDEHFFMPLASPNKVVYWECICKLFSVMDHQLSFGVERDVLVEELQYYFESSQAADLEGEDVEEYQEILIPCSFVERQSVMELKD